MQTNPAVEQRKTLNGPRVRGISPVGKEKVYEGNEMKEMSLDLRGHFAAEKEGKKEGGRKEEKRRKGWEKKYPE